MFDTLRQITHNPKMAESHKRALMAALHALGEPVGWPLARLRRRPPPLGPAPRILIVRADAIGDFVMTTPLFPALRRAYPNATLDLLCRPSSGPFAELFSDILNEIMFWEHESSLSEIRSLAERLSERRYNAVVDARGDARYVLLLRLIQAPRRYGFTYAGFDYMLTHAVNARGLRPVEGVARMAEALGAPLPHPEPTLPLRPDHHAFANEWLAAHGYGASHADGVEEAPPLVAMHMGATRPAKLWPPERYEAVATHLQTDACATLLLLGGPEDRDQAEAFSAALPRPALVLAGEATLPQTAAVLAQCRLFVGNDSGPAHIAAAVGCPVVALFGPTDSRYYRPWGDHCRVVTSTRPCSPRCDQKTCAVPRRHCMETITVDAVMNAALSLLSRSSAPRPIASEEVRPCA